MSNPAIDFPWEKTNVTQSVLVSDRKGVLHTITINKWGTTNIILRDGLDAAATPFATIVTGEFPPVCLLFDCELTTGLYIECGAADWDVTATWK